MRLASAAILAALLVSCRSATEAPELRLLDGPSYEALKRDFNHASGAQRVLVLLSPT